VIRHDGRRPEDLRPVRIQAGALEFAEGSALIEMGKTRVLCAVTVEPRVPQFARNTGSGWVTAEYGMLPRSSPQRIPRERQSGRVFEIQRLIGRSLRAVTQLDLLGERTFIIDCDVLQADGGTRTAAITGGFVALAQAMHHLWQQGELPSWPLRGQVAAVSVGIVDGIPMLDLSYEEDSRAQVDMNVVMTDAQELVEIQGTAEALPFSRKTLDQLLDLAATGIKELLQVQAQALAQAGIQLP
jgi:ribonuclease PH